MPTKTHTTPDTISADQLTTVEKGLLDEIISDLQKHNMTLAEAESLAKEFLSLLPITDKQDLMNKLLQLKTGHSQANKVFLQYAAPFEEEKRAETLEMMRQEIRNGNIQQAITIAKKL